MSAHARCERSSPSSRHFFEGETDAASQERDEVRYGLSARNAGYEMRARGYGVRNIYPTRSGFILAMDCTDVALISL